MAEQFYIPKLGQTVEEITIIKWLVDDGTRVAQGQEIVEVQTDKTIFPVEANAAGYLHIGPYKAGDVVPVLTVVALIGGPNDRFDLAPGQTVAFAETLADRPTAAEPMVAAALPAPADRQPTGSRVFASPRARRLARARQVNLAAVTPTGGSGVRVRESDVMAFWERSPLLVPAMVPEGQVERAPAGSVGSLTMEANAAEFIATRARLASNVEKAWGFAPDDTDLLLLVLGKALRRFPYMNARIQADQVVRLAEVNVAVTVETETDESQVVLRDVDRRGLREIGTVRRALEDRARRGASLPEDLAAGAFTLSNLGECDVNGYTPAVRAPQAAVLGIGSIALRPFAREGRLVAWPVVTLSLSFDHRLTGGAPAARFLQFIKRSIEQPFLWLLY